MGEDSREAVLARQLSARPQDTGADIEFLVWHACRIRRPWCEGGQMVTAAQINKLAQRIDQVAEQLGLAVRPTYVVWLSFHGETDEAFYARHPDARGRRHKATVLTFGNGAATRPFD